MLSYEESLQRLEYDLAKNLKNNGFTMAGYMDIENLQKCLEENTNLKMQIDELIKKYQDMYRNTDKVAEANFEMFHGTRANYKSILGLNKEIIDDLFKLKEVKK